MSLSANANALVYSLLSGIISGGGAILGGSQPLPALITGAVMFGMTLRAYLTPPKEPPTKGNLSQ